ncbi:MAG: oxidoreductase [Pseudooceanicola sp.]|nr:oxidoreductase [Pseudooceanicola sp.]|tara:strand:- start:4181 stop:4564 length:384 start_codon:yes stop_codon:yes gene_type:complete
MSVIVTDEGFATEDWAKGLTDGQVIDLESDTDPEALSIPNAALIRIAFPSFSDGRGFTIARVLRRRGYTGKLRALGHVISDQYAMARRCGFDEVEISNELAARQPQDQWKFRADWRGHDYQSRMRAG